MTAFLPVVDLVDPGLIYCSPQALGTGGFGKVCLGQVRKGNQIIDVAIKISKQNVNRIQYVTNEAALMSHFNHENIVKLIGMMYPLAVGTLPWVIMEYMEHGHLIAFMRAYPKLCDEAFKVRATRSVVSAMKYLNVDMGIVHGDLHSYNVLIGGFGKIIKVADFGLSFKIKYEEWDERRIVQLGRPKIAHVIPHLMGRWRAPEWMPGNGYRQIVTKEGDVWSFGNLLFELWNNGRVPFYSKENVGLVCIMVAGGYNTLDFNDCKAPDRILNIMHRCFAHIPAKRPSFKQIQNVLDDNFLNVLDSKFYPERKSVDDEMEMEIDEDDDDDESWETDSDYSEAHSSYSYIKRVKPKSV